MSFTVYILHCQDKTLYTGYTTDIKRRLLDHNEGMRGARYTKTRRPVKLVYAKRFRTRSAAMKREAEIKKLSRTQKLKLIQTRKAYQK